GGVLEPRISPVELQLLPVEGDETRRERRTRRALERGIDGPVLDRPEALDLLLALADDPQRDRLDASGRKPAPDLLPEEVRDLVAHEPVDDAAGLLRVHQASVDLPRVLHGSLDGLLGDLVEAHALEDLVAGGGPQGFLEMPGDGFAFPIRVRREIDRGGLPRGFLELPEGLLFSRQNLVGRLVGVAAVDAEALARQVAH